MLVFHSWKNTWGFKELEIDYLILSKKLKLIVIVESKRSLSQELREKIKIQLPKITDFFLENIPIRTEGWRMVKTIAFTIPHDRLTVCPNCEEDFMWNRNDIDLKSWWKKLTINTMAHLVEGIDTSDDMDIEGGDSTFAEILKYLIFYSYKVDFPFLHSPSSITRKICHQLEDKIGTNEQIIAFYTKEQKGILLSSRRKLYLKAGFGTGKTILLISKALEIAAECQKQPLPRKGVKFIVAKPINFSKILGGYFIEHRKFNLNLNQKHNTVHSYTNP